MRHWTLYVPLVVLCLTVTGWGQEVGNPDTLFIGSVQVNAGQKAIVNVNFYNDEPLAALTIPFVWDSPDVTLDSVSFVGGRIDYLASKPVTIYNATQSVVFGCIVFLEEFIPAGQGLLAKMYFNVPAGTPDQFVQIDSGLVGVANLLFTNPDATSFEPVLITGKITIGNPVLPGQIVLNPTSMAFQGYVNGAHPAAQVLTITDGFGNGYAWTSSVSSSWLFVTPSGGSAPSITQVRPVTTGLPIGVYYDTIVISSPTAVNSPQRLPVTLTITTPPPSIQPSPSSISVSAIQGGANPPDKYLKITTGVPNSVLNWTVTASSLWLSLFPTSGTPPDSVELSFDITGLPYGVYYDTVVISDPLATNTPRRVPVTLQVVSDLPVLAIDPPILHVIVPAGTSIPDENVLIYNTGEGAMTYSATEGNQHITGLTPDAGTAPQMMAITFKTFPLQIGNYWDTVVVTSPEAINSPQLLITHLHVTATPATLGIAPTNVTFNYFECWQGPDAVPETRLVQIFNTGGDLINWSLTHNQDWLVTIPTSGEADSYTTLSLNAVGMPVGVYYDTIVISSDDAINSPRYVYVTLNVVPGAQTPEMVFDSNFLSIPAQEVFGMLAHDLAATGSLYNKYPGCMDYHVEEDIPWLVMLDTAGVAPDTLRSKLEIGSYTYGTYIDSFFVYSNSASNSPVKVPLRLLVWRYHGDNNWDNRVNVADVVYIVNFIFKAGPQPKPEILVGDVNCDWHINVADAVFLLNHTLGGDDAPCGNP